MRHRAFTLIELLVVISIISLLSSVVLASLNAARGKATTSASKQQSASVFRALADSLVLQLDFDDCSATSTADLSGTGIMAPITAVPIVVASSYNNLPCALTFDGVSEYIQMPNTVSFNDQNFAASVWFKTSTSGDRKIISMNVTSHPLQIFGNNIRTCVNGTCNVGATTVTDNAWHFAIVVGTTANTSLYLDGKSTPETVISPASATISGAPTIAALATLSNFYGGTLDEVRIYSRNLTSMEMRDLYLAGAARHGMQVADMKY